jgi:hypothetical protein
MLKRKDEITLLVVSFFCGGLSLAYGLQDVVDGDDVYHLHAIWLVGQGIVPYREFFEIHPPGLWVVAGALASTFSTPSVYLLAARACVAVMVAITTWLAGRALRARGLQSLVLGVFVCGIVAHVQFWIFRAEYVATVLFMLHLALLAEWVERPTDVVKPFLAAAALAFACTMTVRVLPFMLIQPAALLFTRRGVWRQSLVWLLGIAVGAAPGIIYLSAHRLWPEMWYWAFRFVSDPTVVEWSLRVERGDVFLVLFGATALATTIRRGSVVADRRMVIITMAWLAAVFFHFTNPHKINFAAVHILLLTAMLLTNMVGVISSREVPLRRSGALVCLGVSLLFYARMVSAVPFPIDRHEQKMQLSVLDWLGRVAGSEPVILIAPNHPMLARDATYLQNAWQYGIWIEHEAIRARLGTMGDALLHRPPVVAGDPERLWTDGRDLVTWLGFNGVLPEQEIEQIRLLLASDYTPVSFPVLARSCANRFGTWFWVRQDRLAAAPPPEPFTVFAGGSPPGEVDVVAGTRDGSLEAAAPSPADTFRECRFAPVPAPTPQTARRRRR